MSVVLEQIIYLLILILIYFGGGFVASLSIEELKDAKKYLRALSILLVPIAFGLSLSVWSTTLISIIISISLLIILLTVLREKNIFFIQIFVLVSAILSGNLPALQITGLFLLIQGILDYSDFYKKKTLLKSIFFKKSSYLFFIPLILILIVGLIV